MKTDKDGWIINSEGEWIGTINHENKTVSPTHGYFPDFSGFYQKDWEYCFNRAITLQYAYICDGLDLTIKAHYNFYKKWFIYYKYPSYQSSKEFQKAISKL